MTTKYTDNPNRARYARGVLQSAYPHLWSGLKGAWINGFKTGGAGSANVVRDFSLRPHHAAFNGSMTDADWSFGVWGDSGGYAIDLDGNDDYLSASFPYNFSSYSAMAWINPDSLSGFQRLITGGSSQRWSLLLNGNKLAQIANANGEYTQTSTATLSTGIWSHVAVVKDMANSITYLYINGQQDSTTISSSSDPLATTILEIGRLDTGIQYYNGKIANVLVYDRVLQAQEILQIYQGASPFTPKAPPAAARYIFPSTWYLAAMGAFAAHAEKQATECD